MMMKQKYNHFHECTHSGNESTIVNVTNWQGEISCRSICEKKPVVPACWELQIASKPPLVNLCIWTWAVDFLPWRHKSSLQHIVMAEECCSMQLYMYTWKIMQQCSMLCVWFFSLQQVYAANSYLTEILDEQETEWSTKKANWKNFRLAIANK